MSELEHDHQTLKNVLRKRIVWARRELGEELLTDFKHFTYFTDQNAFEKDFPTHELRSAYIDQVKEIEQELEQAREHLLENALPLFLNDTESSERPEQD